MPPLSPARSGSALKSAILLLILALLSPARVAAEADKAAASSASSAEAAVFGAPPGYDETVRLALREFELENYAEARTGFLKAHKLYPNARTLRALGLVAYELKNYVTSIDHLAAALDSSVRPLTNAQRSEVENVLARARGYVGRYKLSLRPAGARLFVDGELLEQAQGKVLSLSVGDHALEAQAEGYRTLRKNLEVIGGAEENLDLTLLALKSEPHETHATSETSEARPLRKQWWLWVTLGVVVAGGIATGLVLGLPEPKPTGATGGTTNAVLTLPSTR
jgi:tetratricopeptide (TPR) repeat protein